MQCKKAAGNHFPKRCCPNATRVRKSLPRRADALIGHPAVIGRQASVAGVRLRAVQCPPDAGSGIGTSYDPQSRQGVIGRRYAYQTTSDCCPRGYYVIDDGVLTMAKANGIPVRRPEGGEYTHKLKPEDNARSIAGRPLREPAKIHAAARTKKFFGDLHTGRPLSRQPAPPRAGVGPVHCSGWRAPGTRQSRPATRMESSVRW